MEDMEKTIDQSQLANDVSEKIPYEFMDEFLVKPLDPIKVKKEFTKLPENKPATVDKEGIEAVDVNPEELETEIKEVDSNFRKGIILKTPASFERWVNDEHFNGYKFKVGDIILYRNNSGRQFDLLKDSVLIKQYDIVAIER